MLNLRPPTILFEGRRWPSEELAAIALDWRDTIRTESADATMLAVPMLTDPLAVALFFALSTLRTPMILLPPDPRGWRSSPALPPGTPIVLLPELRALAPEVARRGLGALVLPEPRVTGGRGEEDTAFLSCPGLVVLTSGSTTLPKPVYRALPSVLAAVAARLEAFGLPRGGAILGTMPLFRGNGLHNSVLAATLLESPLALLARFAPGPVLSHFASGEYRYWSATQAMVDTLVRSSWRRPCQAPPVCLSTSVPVPVARAFQDRFGAPIRSGYSTTESGMVTLDAAVAAEVRPDTLGRPLPGTGLLIGDSPGRPQPSGQPGRIWVRTPWTMGGYGFPPHLERPDTSDGWWPTRDIGRVDEAGYLILLGREDDCVKTGAGHLVNLAEIAAALVTHPGVTDAAVVPLDGPMGLSIGALVEISRSLGADALRAHAAHTLAPWCQPRVLRMTDRLPRLPGGKVDRMACRALLE